MGEAPGFTERSFGFLEELAANNNRAWYKAHRDRHRDALEMPFARMLGAASEALSEEGVELSGGKRTMFRLQRDTRFSEDKTPYKTSVSGMLTPSGEKREAYGVVYAQIDAAGGFMAAGYHALTPKRLEPIRRRILEEDAAFRDMLGGLEAAGFPLDRTNALTAMPRGFQDEKDHPLADYVKLKSFLIREDLEREVWMSGEVVDLMVRMATAALPLLAFGRVG